MAQYLSPEWCAEAKRLIKEQLTPENMNNATTSLSNIYRHCPDGKERYLYIKFENGDPTVFEVGEGVSPKAEFKVSGDYETFAKISRAELVSQKALMTGKLTLSGNMAKALSLTPIMDRFNKVLSQVTTEF
jgi:putative sterol carrier protein